MVGTPKDPGGRTNSECGACGRSFVKPRTRAADRRLSNRYYSLRCVNVEEYESALIEKYHCERCAFTHGPTLMKQAILDHRYAFEDASQVNEVMLIHTDSDWNETLYREFQKNLRGNTTRVRETLSTSEHLASMADGYEFARAFNRKEVWKKVYLIENVDGLGIRLPPKSFSLKDCVDVVGAKRVVDTIDVYKQYTFQMSFGRFYEHFMAKERPRLYNILSLEFSDSR
ncbi:unnamed protein product [Toxocara canis]|uniref:Restriction endonuclease n=1 Tax=Toxocara canis TaxID=6265 RepID=A0A183UTF4_TOXCA|nr:unnamed protein product [Toxocara canis]